MVRIINAAGRRWVLGIGWLYDKKRRSLSDIRKEGRATKADWYVIRTSVTATQTGFCSQIQGEGPRPRRLFSLAAAVADIKASPWLGEYKIADDLYWLIAVGDKQAIIPGGDVVGTKAQVDEVKRDLLGHGGWNTFEGTLEDLLPILKNRKQLPALSRVRSLTPISPMKIFAPPVAAIGVVGLACWAWSLHEAELAAAQRAAAEAKQQKAPAPQPVSPLLLTPTPATWLAACRSTIGSLPLAEDGWALTDVSCSGSQATAAWTRLDGATVALRPSGALSDDGNGVVMSLPLGGLPPGPDDSRGLEAGKIALFALLQPMGVQAQFMAAPQPPTLPGAAPSNQPAPPQVRQVRQVQFTLPIAPWDMSFVTVPGLRITDIQQSSAGWNVTGEFYGW